MGNNIRSSSRPKALAPSIPMPPLADAMDAVHLSVDRFCLLAGVEALAEMMEEDATTVCGARHRRHGDRRGYRWGRTPSEIGYHGGKVKVARPRVRDRAGKEVSLESWQALRDGNLLLEWALNLMVLNVSTRKYQAEADDGEDLLQPLQDAAARDARFLMLQTSRGPDQVAQEPLGLVCVVLVPGLTERAARTPALARLHQHRRERARHGAPGHPQRQTLETRRDGAQMDRRRPAGGPENLPSPQGLSPAAHPPKCSPGTLEKGSGRQCH